MVGCNGRTADVVAADMRLEPVTAPVASAEADREFRGMLAHQSALVRPARGCREIEPEPRLPWGARFKPTTAGVMVSVRGRGRSYAAKSSIFRAAPRQGARYLLSHRDSERVMVAMALSGIEVEGI